MHTSLLNIKSIAGLHVVRERIVGVHQTVPVLDGGKRTYINFDNAASTPALQDVLRKVNDFMQWYSSVHRGTGFKSRVATQAYEDARHIPPPCGQFYGVVYGISDCLYRAST